MAGRFLVLEGGDGSGKSTQARLAASSLRERGVPVCETFEPGATPAGAVIRELLLHRPVPIAASTEALLMAADRAQHVTEQIAPSLAAGTWVVSDRYLPSSLVYQGVVRGLGVDVVEELNLAATAGVSPDLTVVLDVADVVAAQRRGELSDRLESEGDAFHAAVRAAYRSLAADRGWLLVDGDGDVETVRAHVWSLIEPLLAG